MLVRLRDGVATSRVLAGTLRRSGDLNRDLRQGHALARSIKDVEEHGYGVRSVADALALHCDPVEVPADPFVLELPNVMHLATDVTGTVTDGATSLGLVASLHPSAAVCGTPDRGRPRADPHARGARPRPVRRPGRLAGRQRRRRVGHRPAVRRGRPGRRAAAAAVRRLRDRRRARSRSTSSRRATPSWCPCGTRCSRRGSGPGPAPRAALTPGTKLRGCVDPGDQVPRVVDPRDQAAVDPGPAAGRVDPRDQVPARG